MVDRREHSRSDASVEARLFLRGTAATIIPCKVLNLSEGGAKVGMEVPYLLPPRVFLVKDEGEIIHECDVVWQDEHTAGLGFRDLCARAKRQGVLEEIRAAEFDDWGSATRLASDSF